MPPFAVITSPQEMRSYAEAQSRKGAQSVLVPTMGAIHPGHLSLLRIAEKNGGDIIVSIFVNPTQFRLDEDFHHYPRQLHADMKTLAESGIPIAAVYAPQDNEIYPQTFATHIDLPSLSGRLCGKSRPEHFSGVATVVAKLLNQTQAQSAVFGEKDYQQLTIIRRMVQDLNFNVKILAAPTMREADGLAMSSRNAYLTAETRQIAPKLYDTLRQCRDNIIQTHNIQSTLQNAKQKLKRTGFDKIDYIYAVHSHNLTILKRYDPEQPTRLLAAAYLGQARLIDNIKLTDKT